MYCGWGMNWVVICYSGMTPIIGMLLHCCRWWSTRPAQPSNELVMKCLRQKVLYTRECEAGTRQRNTDHRHLKQISAGDGDANWKPNRRDGFHSHGLDELDVFNTMITCVTPSMLHLGKVPECMEDAAAAAKKRAGKHCNEARP